MPAAREAAAIEARARRWLSAATAVSATSTRSMRRAAMSVAAESDKAEVPCVADGAWDNDAAGGEDV